MLPQWTFLSLVNLTLSLCFTYRMVLSLPVTKVMWIL